MAASAELKNVMFTLYNAPQSTCSQRVRFVLNAKRLASWKRSSTSWPAISSGRLPQAQSQRRVPTLDHDGEIVIDSAVICEYLDEIAPAPECFTPPSRSRAPICAP